MMAAYDADANSIRSNFSDYSFWEPRLRTDAKGIAKFNVTFPDDVTSWQTFVLAMNDKKQSGQTNGQIKSFKPLMAQLSVPRFLVEGDSTLAIGKVLNYTPDTLSLNTSLTINDSTYFTKNTDCINSIIDSLLITPFTTDTLNITYFLKKEDGYFDGEQRKIPVVPIGMNETHGVFYALDTDTTLNLEFDPDLGEVTLYAKSNLSDVLENEIDHVYAYKYDCNEQLASKLKALLALKTIREYKGESFPKDKRINQLINAINKNRNKDEQWGWWHESPTSYWISNHVLESLLLAQEQGYNTKINEDVIFDQLFWRLQGNTNSTDKIKILKILKLINAQIDFVSYIKEIKLNKKNSFHDLLLFMDLKQRCGVTMDLDTLDHYSNYTMMGNEYFADSAESLNIVSNTVQNTLLAYIILSRDAATSALRLRKISNFFLEERKLGYWANTYQSAQIIEAILPDILKSKQKSISPSVKISGSLNAEISAFPFDTTLRATDKIKIVKTGDFPVYLTAYQSGWNTNPSRQQEEFELVTRFSNPDSSLLLVAGKEVSLILDLEVRKDAEYVMIEVPIPAGCSYASEETNFRLEAHREYFKEKTSIFCESLKKGRYKFELKLLPRYSGTYHLNPAKAELMYFPTFYGNNEIKRVLIE